MSLDIKFKKLDSEAKLPLSLNEGDAAYDLHCIEDFSIAPGETKVVGTGLQLADVCMNPSWLTSCSYENPSTTHYIQFLGRSGLASKTVMPLGGVCDLSYRGELKVILYNGNQKASLTIEDVLEIVKDPNDYNGYIDRIDRRLRFENEEKTYHFKKGDRIAQIIVNKIVSKNSINMVEVEKITETSRGASGFGSTGR